MNPFAAIIQQVRKQMKTTLNNGTWIILRMANQDVFARVTTDYADTAIEVRNDLPEGLTPVYRCVYKNDTLIPKAVATTATIERVRRELEKATAIFQGCYSISD